MGLKVTQPQVYFCMFKVASNHRIACVEQTDSLNKFLNRKKYYVCGV